MTLLSLQPEQQKAIDLGDTLPRLFLQRVRENPDRVAMRQREKGIWRAYTWGECYERAASLAHGLHQLGLGPGEALCILADNCTEWLWADLAGEALGAVIVGIYPTNTAEQVAYIVRHAGARFVVAMDEEQLDKLVAARAQLPHLEKIILIKQLSKRVQRLHGDLVLAYGELEAMGRQRARAAPDWFFERALQVQPEATSVLVYTSGTSGDPKGTMLSHQNQVTAVRGLAEVVPFTADDLVISFLPLCHIFERTVSIGAFLNYGYTLHFGEGVETIQRDLRETAPTLFFAVPRIWEKIYASHQYSILESNRLVRRLYAGAMRVATRRLDLRIEDRRVPLCLRALHAAADWLVLSALRDQFGLRRVRFAMSGAAPIDPEILRFFATLGVPIAEAYGMTECAGGIAMTRADEFRFGTVGRVFSILQCKIADDGEILLRGDTVFQGYWRDPETTARTVVDGWLHTGDIGELSADGVLRITDRKKDLIITAGGKNIAPQEIENRLKVSPFIKESVAVGDKRKYIAALIQIDYENVGQWAEAQGIEYTTFKSLAAHPKVYALIGAEVEKANATLGRVEQVKRFVLLDKELDQDDAELTATQKVRRKVIEERYADLIAGLYGES